MVARGCLPLLMMLIAITLSVNEVILNTYQSNVTSNSSNTIYLSSYDGSGNNLATGAGNIITFYTRDGSGYWGNPYSRINISNTLTEARFRDDGAWVAVIDNTTNNIYLFNKAPIQYDLNQTIDCGSRPKSISWAYDGNLLLAGLASGNVNVYTINSTTQQFYQKQVLFSGHSGGVSKISGRKSRFVTCGMTDNAINIWYYNSTTGNYNTTVNQTLTNVAAQCTAIHMASTEQLIAVAVSNGTVNILQRNPIFVYSSSPNPFPAHTSSVNFVRFTSDGEYLLTAGASPDNTTKLWTKANLFGTATSYPINGQSVDWDNNFKEFAIGTFGSTSGLNTIQRLVASNCATGSISTTDATACTCSSGQVWFNGNCTIFSVANCPSNTTAGTVNTSTTGTCNCNTGWVWDPNLQACKLNCDSTFVTNSNGTNYEYNSCFCNSGFNWDHIAMVCSSYFNCAAIANSPGTNNDSRSCNCNPGFIWNITSLKCVKNCSSVNTGPSLNLDDTTQCVCPTNYVYNATWVNVPQGVCQRNCSNYSRASVVSNSDYLKCYCINGYIWDTTVPGCTLACYGMIYSTGSNSNTTVCNCKSGYRWDYAIGQCVSNNYNPTVAIACGIAIPLGILALLGLGALLWWCLTPRVISYPPPLVSMPVYGPQSQMIQQVMTPNQIMASGSALVPQAKPQIVTRQVIGAPMSNITPYATIAPPQTSAMYVRPGFVPGVITPTPSGITSFGVGRRPF